MLRPTATWTNTMPSSENSKRGANTLQKSTINETGTIPLSNMTRTAPIIVWFDSMPRIVICKIGIKLAGQKKIRPAATAAKWFGQSLRIVAFDRRRTARTSKG
jgi:hypothetical protein